MVAVRLLRLFPLSVWLGLGRLLRLRFFRLFRRLLLLCATVVAAVSIVRAERFGAELGIQRFCGGRTLPGDLRQRLAYGCQMRVRILPNVDGAVLHREAHLGLFRDGVVLKDRTRSVHGHDLFADLRHLFLHIFIGMLFVLQTAHQPAAKARNLGRAERKILLLCHLDGNGAEIVQKRLTADGTTARTEAAQHLCLVTHTDLAKLDACFQRVCKVLDQLAEVHPLVCGEVEHDLAAIERVLHVHELHVQLVILDLLQANGERFALFGGILGTKPLVLVGGKADDRLERRDQLAFLHLFYGAGNLTEFQPTCRFHDDAVAILQQKLQRIEIIDSSARFKFYSYYFNHVCPFLSKPPASRSIPVRAKPCTTICVSLP